MAEGPGFEFGELLNMTLHVAPRKFTVEEYARMGEAGVFRPDERVELIEGEILPMTPQNLPHARRIEQLNTRFVLCFSETHFVRVQLPLTLGEHSEPEPDFAIVPQAVSATSERHPDTADLVIEISDTSLSYDRNEKASLYAKFGIPEYWILNLKNRRLEVRTRPSQNPEGTFQWSYSEIRLLAPEESISPAFAPAVNFPVGELLGD